MGLGEQSLAPPKSEVEIQLQNERRFASLEHGLKVVIETVNKLSTVLHEQAQKEAQKSEKQAEETLKRARTDWKLLITIFLAITGTMTGIWSLAMKPYDKSIQELESRSQKCHEGSKQMRDRVTRLETEADLFHKWKNKRERHASE
jgi:hypothetical protein